MWQESLAIMAWIGEAVALISSDKPKAGRCFPLKVSCPSACMVDVRIVIATWFRGDPSIQSCSPLIGENNVSSVKKGAKVGNNRV